jgi:hypothetical protein
MRVTWPWLRDVICWRVGHVPSRQNSVGVPEVRDGVAGTAWYPVCVRCGFPTTLAVDGGEQHG